MSSKDYTPEHYLGNPTVNRIIAVWLGVNVLIEIVFESLTGISFQSNMFSLTSLLIGSLLISMSIVSTKSV